MSDIVTPNAKPPTNCFTCDYEKLTENCPCYIGICSASDYKDSRHTDCPLKDVRPHGDLVDRQKLIKALSKAWDVDDDQDFANKSVWRIVEKEAPTIIEASTCQDNRPMRKMPSD